MKMPLTTFQDLAEAIPSTKPQLERYTSNIKKCIVWKIELKFIIEIVFVGNANKNSG